jgi:hypothetical protein
MPRANPTCRAPCVPPTLVQRECFGSQRPCRGMVALIFGEHAEVEEHGCCPANASVAGQSLQIELLGTGGVALPTGDVAQTHEGEANVWIVRQCACGGQALVKQ